MTIVSLETENLRADGAVKLDFSDGSSLSFSLFYLPETLLQTFAEVNSGAERPAVWEPGRELSSGEEEAFRFASTCYRVEKIALRLVARAEQNSLGLAAKLERRGYNAVVVKAVISRLLDRNLLDDGRYAELWIRSRLAMGKAPSPRWLLISLGKRGIDRYLSREALGKVLDPETEYALLLKYLEKTGIPEEKKVRRLRAQLKYEGFSFDVLDRFFND